MFATCRTCTRIVTRRLGQLAVCANETNYRERLPTAVAAAGAGATCLIIYHYKEDVKKWIGVIARDLVKQKLQLHAAGKKARRKTTRKAAATGAAGAAAAGTVANSAGTKQQATSWKERRFVEFASVEYRGQAYMTAADFLDSLLEETPSSGRVERRVLTEGEAERMINVRGSLSKDYLRSLGQDGLISYTEYLFLLCILIKPQSSFQVAFKMLDTDGNQYVDKNEFLVMERIFSNTRFAKRLLQGHTLEWSTGNGSPVEVGSGKNGDPDEDHVHPHPTMKEKVEAYGGNVRDTTLMRRFFGRRGRKTLGYDDFRRFMEDLQTEILEAEFNKFSNSQPTIKETDFARLLLRHAFAYRDAFQAYMKHVGERIHDGKGITFDQYRQFCLFLMNLDDFAMAVKLYTFSDLPVTPGEFARAAKVSTGFALDPHLVKTLFNIFDINDDGRLSYGEFISVMRDRLKRGPRPAIHRSEWQLFKKCVREEIKRY